MSGLQELRNRRLEVLHIAASHGAANLRVFGSAARGEERFDSDVDILVEMESGRSLYDLVGLQQDLEELLHRPVDVLTERGLNPYLKARILAEAVPL